MELYELGELCQILARTNRFFTGTTMVLPQDECRATGECHTYEKFLALDLSCDRNFIRKTEIWNWNLESGIGNSVLDLERNYYISHNFLGTQQGVVGLHN
jgi:hypothetical protein